MKIAFLGPIASFSYEAALRLFLKATLSPVETIPLVFSSVDSSKAEFGIVPLENSIDGSISPVLDALTVTKLVIVAEYYLDVKQCFLSNEKDISKINKIFSHPQGFAQCRTWIAKNFPKAELIECSSTARAAERASKEKFCGAIASESCAKEFLIKLVNKGIQDLDGNKTRFVVISKPENSSKFVLPKNAKFKTSILFSVKDKPGSLFDALKAFKEFNVNMTKIESRPSKKNAWEYVFFIDLDGKVTDPPLSNALKEIEKHCEYVKILGSYSRVE